MPARSSRRRLNPQRGLRAGSVPVLDLQRRDRHAVAPAADRAMPAACCRARSGSRSPLERAAAQRVPDLPAEVPVVGVGGAANPAPPAGADAVVGRSSAGSPWSSVWVRTRSLFFAGICVSFGKTALQLASSALPGGRAELDAVGARSGTGKRRRRDAGQRVVERRLVRAGRGRRRAGRRGRSRAASAGRAPASGWPGWR